MKIQESYDKLPLAEAAPGCVIFRNGHTENREELLICEHLIHVYINDVLTMKLVCTPQYLTELVLGRLLTEGMIQDAGDVVDIYICKYGARARVFLRETSPVPKESTAYSEQNLPSDPEAPSTYVEQDPTCCTDNHILNDFFSRNQSLQPLAKSAWTFEEAFHLADHFKKGSPLHSQTNGAHSCTLAVHGKILFSCEDIGRHNALDKCLGYALRHEIRPEECMIYSSGRIPVDMARKAILARIPVLISKAVPTRQAVELAKQYGLVLLCQARGDSMKRYA